MLNKDTIKPYRFFIVNSMHRAQSFLLFLYVLSDMLNKDTMKPYRFSIVNNVASF